MLMRARHDLDVIGRRRDHEIRLGREIAITRASILITAVGLVLFEMGMVLGEADAGAAGAIRSVEAAVFTVMVTFLVYGNLVYQAARLGYLTRRRGHRPPSRSELDELYSRPARPVVALIPSYREEPAVVRQAILSAALQSYPHKRVVLLIDDPPEPASQDARRLLSAARALPVEVTELLERPARDAQAAFAEFQGRTGASPGRVRSRRWLRHERRQLAAHHDQAAGWLERLAKAEPADDHTDALFAEQVLRAAARDHRQEANDLRHAQRVDEPRLWLGYRRLVSRFEVEVTAFERKAFVNLSREVNKAMNLNSYIGLLGGSWRRVQCDDGWQLVPAGDDEADLVVDDASYVLTLDADSVLVPSYALRLVHVLEQTGNERMAVAQTPYSAVPGALGPLERTAGATTDLQYIVHQGFTRHGATFWVGANALIRRAALEDLASIDVERGYPVSRFIQDRTVIEDTESSVDLIGRGWRLFNYPERLSFSATPPDFGALLIQRRRWANGGLIILPKLVRHLLRRRDADGGTGESLMRIHYLTSISGTSVGLLLLLGYPFKSPGGAIWLPLCALPYFFLYARDLHQAGYRRRDLVPIYALSLLLIPVNLAGVIKSVHQGLTGKRIPFGRTPKVGGRTAVPSRYLVAEIVLLGYWTMGTGWDLAAARWGHAGIQAANVVMLSYAIGRFIGWRALLADLRPHRRRLDMPEPAAAVQPEPAAPGGRLQAA